MMTKKSLLAAGIGTLGTLALMLTMASPAFAAGRFTAEQKAKIQAVRTAIVNDDYAAFRTAAGEGLTSKIDTQADFQKLVEANNLRKAGDRKGAHAIMKELGFHIGAIVKHFKNHR
jgi:hypothetical protein